MQAAAAQPHPVHCLPPGLPAPAWEGGGLPCLWRTRHSAPCHTDMLTRAHSTHPSTSVLSHPHPQPLCAPPSLSPHVPLSPCHQCRVLHGHTCSHVHIHALGLSPPPRSGLTLTLPMCAPAPRYARPPAHPHHRPGRQHRAPQSQRRPQVLPGIRGETSPLTPASHPPPCAWPQTSSFPALGSRLLQNTHWRGQQWPAGNSTPQVLGLTEALPAPQVRTLSHMPRC